MKFKPPKGVVIKNGAFKYRPYIPQKLRGSIPTDKGGRANAVRLCSADAPEHVLLKALAAVKEQYASHQISDYLTLNWLHTHWINHQPSSQDSACRAYQGLAKSTRKRYDGCKKLLEHPLEIDGKASTLGHVIADQLTTYLIRQILDKRYQTGTTPAQLNNELAMLGSMYKYAKQYRPELALADSPTRGIEKYTVKTRTRFVDDTDYRIQYQVAQTVGRPALLDYMELAFLLAARGCEVFDLTVGSANENGVVVIRRKGSKDTGINWNPRLKQAWDRALSRHAAPKPHHQLIVCKRGKPITKSAIDDAWGLVREAMKAKGLGHIYFTAHDLKRKRITESKNKAIAGQTEAMQRRYDVNVDWFD